MLDRRRQQGSDDLRGKAETGWNQRELEARALALPPVRTQAPAQFAVSRSRGFFLPAECPDVGGGGEKKTGRLRKRAESPEGMERIALLQTAMQETEMHQEANA